MAACFSLERTKYLMLSKSMPDRSEPQVGMGLRWKSLRPFRRRSSIHCGSFFFAEMSRTTSSLRPRLAAAPATSRVGPAELVAADALELGVELFDGGHVVTCSFVGGRLSWSAGRAVCGMQVVQTPSPWAMVASRCTWRPSTRPMASVSASHSCGNSWATWETGQCCWHSCSPADRAASRTEAAYPSSVKHLGQHLGRASARGRPRSTSREALLDERHPPVGRTPGRPRRRRSRRGSAAPATARSSYCWSKRVAAGLGEREHLRRAAAAAGRRRRAARAPRRRPRRAAGRGGGVRRPGVRSSRSARAAAVDGPLTEDRPHDALARRLVVRRGPGASAEFHNTSVPLMPGRFK